MVLDPITTASPTLIWRLIQCGHQEGLRRAAEKPSGLLAVSSAAALGNAAHSVLAQALGLESLNDDLLPGWFAGAWEQAVAHERTHCSESGPAEGWRRYSIIKRGTRRLAASLRSEIADAGATALTETDMHAVSIPLWGRPDVVIQHPDGTVEIVDVKTGDHLESSPSEREMSQLQLYVFIAGEALQATVTRIRIERVDGHSWSGPATLDESHSAGALAMVAVERFNAQLGDTTTLARPGEACAHCRSVLACEPAWESDPTGFVGVQGTLNTISSENGQVTLTVVTPAGIVDIVGISGVNLVPGDELRVAHLRKQSGMRFVWLQGRSLLQRRPAET